MRSLLNQGGKMLVVEPKYHVTHRSFSDMILKLEAAGLQIIDRPKITFSRSLVLSAKES